MPHAFLGRFANPSTERDFAQEPASVLRSVSGVFGETGLCASIKLFGPDWTIETLAAILVNPTATFRGILAQRLYLVHEMATDRGMQDLLEVPAWVAHVDGRDSTAADVALRSCFGTAHSGAHACEQFLIRTRSFYVWSRLG